MATRIKAVIALAIPAFALLLFSGWDSAEDPMMVEVLPIEGPDGAVSGWRLAKCTSQDTRNDSACRRVSERIARSECRSSGFRIAELLTYIETPKGSLQATQEHTWTIVCDPKVNR